MKQTVYIFFRFSGSLHVNLVLKSIIHTICKFLICCNKEETVSENITQYMTSTRVENKYSLTQAF